MRIVLAPLAAAMLVTGCSGAPATQTARVPVTTAHAMLRTFVQTNDFSGTLVALRSVVVGSNASGRISSVPIRVGDRVEAGQVLATIDASAYSAAVSQAQGAHAAAVADAAASAAAVTQARAREQLAAVTAQRDASLYASGDISRQHYDETQAALQTARAAVAQASASAASANASSAQSAAAVDVAAVPLAETVIRAPFAGVVTQKLTDTGAVVTQGSPLVALEQDSVLEAEVAVPEDLAAQLVPGRSVNISVDALRGSVPGRIRAIIPSPNVALHTATIRLSVDPHAGLLRGMFVRVRLAGVARQQLAVPAEALVMRSGQAGVFAVKDSHVEFIPVESSDSNDGWIAVSNVTPGTAVVVRGVERLDDGTNVEKQ